MTTNILKELLNATRNKIKQFEAEEEKVFRRGKFFNVLNITGIYAREVYMCKLLAEILNPKGSHAQHTIYLNLFCEKFLKNTPIDFNKVTIKLEVLTKELDENRQQRRIDIVIDDGCYYIPIEVKINAYEQENQCRDYLEQVNEVYRKRNLTCPLILLFLTKDGHSSKSVDNDVNGKVINISWKDICEWLQVCIGQSYELQSPKNVINTLEQYKFAIEEFLETSGEKLMNNIESLLVSNEDYMKSAELISNTVNKAYETLWKNFKDAIKRNYNYPTYHDDDTRLAYEYKKIEEGITECKVFDIYNLRKRGIDILFATYDDNNNRSYVSERNYRAKLCNLSELANNEKFNVVVEKAIEFLKNGI